MTDFSDARNAFCRRCKTWFCPEDGGCNCTEDVPWEKWEDKDIPEPPDGEDDENRPY